MRAENVVILQLIRSEYRGKQMWIFVV